jgi:triacylglycerol esterase/lipase EstA (alpha/beta hydrolase family)
MQQNVGAVDWAVKQAVKYYARLWRGDTYLGTPLATPPKGADPIVLVNGFTVYNEVMEPAARSFRRDGFQVFLPELPNNAMDNVDQTAAYLRSYVDAVLRQTGAKHVDLLGFSEGGLIARAYVKDFGGASKVDSLVTVSTPNNGVLGGALDRIVEGSRLLRKVVPGAARDMLVGSDFLRHLNSGDPTPGAHVRYTSIYSKSFDGIVWPARSPMLEGARNIELVQDGWLPRMQGPYHLGLQGSHEAYMAARAVILEPH